MHRSSSGLEDEGRGTDSWYLMVLMLKPRVGLMTLVSSPLILSTMVVLPELSRPLRRTTTEHHISLHEPMQKPNRKSRKPTAGAPDPNEFESCGGADAYGTERKWRAEGTYTMRMRISFSLRLIFLMMLSSPMISEGKRTN